MKKPKVKYGLKFCPQDFLVDRIKYARRTSGVYRNRTSPITIRQQYRGMNRGTHCPSTSKDFQITVHSNIHYHTRHAPKKVRRRWEQARIRWQKRLHWWKSGLHDRL